jgi:TrmH family RNA methyltransferase
LLCPLLPAGKGDICLKIITSKDNPLVKAITRLKQKKYRNETGMYMLDGLHLVKEALHSGQQPVYLLVDQERQEQYRTFIAEHAALPWYVLESRIMKQISSTESPQGMVAVMPKPQYTLEEVVKPGGLLLILDQLSDPGNVGTIIRTAWGFAVDAILMTVGAVDPFNPKVVRSAMGGSLHVPVVEGVTVQQLQDLKAGGYRLYGTAASGAISVYEADYRGALAIVIGSEARGLSPAVFACCDVMVAIPGRAGVDSLNAAVACGIILCQSWQCRF